MAVHELCWAVWLCALAVLGRHVKFEFGFYCSLDIELVLLGRCDSVAQLKMSMTVKVLDAPKNGNDNKVFLIAMTERLTATKKGHLYSVGRTSQIIQSKF